MRCALCEQAIAEYSKQFNHLIIDTTHEVDVCRSCIHKVMKWQQQEFATLFPSTRAKRWNQKK